MSANVVPAWTVTNSNRCWWARLVTSTSFSRLPVSSVSGRKARVSRKIATDRTASTGCPPLHQRLRRRLRRVLAAMSELALACTWGCDAVRRHEAEALQGMEHFEAAWGAMVIFGLRFLPFQLT
ncbi:MAG: hypothetical protein Q8R98_28570, partial [Rubrivivax sp.]|nr:hypothetical protein [Rubrivivax sp.]